MVTESNLLNLKFWFAEYVKGFQSENADFNANINIKKEHTKRVCIEIMDIAQSLGLNRHEFYLAEVIALLHDVGRFEQYKRYGTYMDIKSADHARLGVTILRKKNILTEIDLDTRELILRVVEHHNCGLLPKGKSGRYLFFLKLLRDADKIDIWRVVTDYYSKRAAIHGDAIELGLPDTPYISEKILADLIAGRIARVEDMQTLNDFKLLQMGWIFDINFPRTFQIVKKRRYLDKIYEVLPQMNYPAASYGVSKVEERKLLLTMKLYIYVLMHKQYILQKAEASFGELTPSD